MSKEKKISKEWAKHKTAWLSSGRSASFPVVLICVFAVFSHEACFNLKTGENTLKKFFFLSNRRLAMFSLKMFCKVLKQPGLALSPQVPQKKAWVADKSVSGTARWLLLFPAGFKPGDQAGT